jgi:hypothetical protein
MTAIILQRMPIKSFVAMPISGEDLFYFILFVLLCFAGYLVLRISFAIMLKVIRYGSNKPAINIVSLVVVPITAFGISLAAVYFIAFSVYLILAHGFDIPSVAQSTFYLLIVIILSMLAFFIVALIAGGVIADTNSRFESLQAIIVGIAIVGLWYLYGYLKGGDYIATSSWVKYLGYVNDVGIILFAFIGRHLFSDFPWDK